MESERERALSAVVRASRIFLDQTRNLVRGSGWGEPTDEDTVEAWERLDRALQRLADSAVASIATERVSLETGERKP